MASSKTATTPLGSPLAVPSSRNRKVGAEDFLYGVLLGEGSYGKVVHGRMKRATPPTNITTLPPILPLSVSPLIATTPTLSSTSSSLSLSTASGVTFIAGDSHINQTTTPTTVPLPSPLSTCVLPSNVTNTPSIIASGSNNNNNNVLQPISPSLSGFQLSPSFTSNATTIITNTSSSLLPSSSSSSVTSSSSSLSNNEFAIKIMDKRFIKREGKTHFVMMERNVMSKALHPNIVKLIYTFQDNYNLYMVSDLCKGGELRHVINYYRDVHRKQMEESRESTGNNSLASLDTLVATSSSSVPTSNGSFSSVQSAKFYSVPAIPIDITRFYIAQIVCALEYLHLNLGVVHRDLKPENILLTEKGFAKVTDFGSSKDETINYEDNRQDTFVGTAEYVSPEILRDEIAHAPVDLWALGCVIYQCLTGRPPFRGASEYLTFQQILGYDYEKTVEAVRNDNLLSKKDYEGCGVYVLEASLNSNDDDVSDFYTSPSMENDGGPVNLDTTGGPVNLDTTQDHRTTSDSSVISASANDPSRGERTASISAALASHHPKVLLRFPSWMPYDAKDIIVQLLHPSPLQRLGVVGNSSTTNDTGTTSSDTKYKQCGPIRMDYSRIRNHPFFTGIDWKLIIDIKHCIPPYTPPERIFPEPVNNTNLPTTLADIDAMSDLSVVPSTATSIPIIDALPISNSGSTNNTLPPLPPPIRSTSQLNNNNTLTPTMMMLPNNTNNNSNRFMIHVPDQSNDSPSLLQHQPTPVTTVNTTNGGVGITITRIYRTNSDVGETTHANANNSTNYDHNLPRFNDGSNYNYNYRNSSRSISPLAVSALPLRSTSSNDLLQPFVGGQFLSNNHNHNNAVTNIPGTPGRTSPISTVNHTSSSSSYTTVTSSSSSLPLTTVPPATPSSRTFGSMLMSFFGGNTPSNGGNSTSRQSSRRNSLSINTNLPTNNVLLPNTVHGSNENPSNSSPIPEVGKFSNDNNYPAQPPSSHNEHQPVAISMISQPRSSNSPLPTSRLLLEEELRNKFTTDSTNDVIETKSGGDSTGASAMSALVMMDNAIEHDTVPSFSTNTSEVRNLRDFLREDHIPIPLHEPNLSSTSSSSIVDTIPNRSLTIIQHNSSSSSALSATNSGLTSVTVTNYSNLPTPSTTVTSPTPQLSSISSSSSSSMDTSSMYWAKFLNSNNGEYAVRWGPIIRRKTYGGLFSRDKQRDLVLTVGGPEGPRLLYCHTPTSSLRTSISLNDPELRVVVRLGNDTLMDDSGTSTNFSRLQLNDIPPTPSSFSRFTQWLGFGSSKRLDTTMIHRHSIAENEGIDNPTLGYNNNTNNSNSTDSPLGVGGITTLLNDSTTPSLPRRLSRARTKSFILGQALSGSPIITGPLSSPSALMNVDSAGNMVSLRDDETNPRSRSFDAPGTPSSYRSPRLSVADMAFVAVTQRSPRLSRVTDRMFTSNLRAVGSSASMKDGSSNTVPVNDTIVPSGTAGNLYIGNSIKVPPLSFENIEDSGIERTMVKSSYENDDDNDDNNSLVAGKNRTEGFETSSSVTTQTISHERGELSDALNSSSNNLLPLNTKDNLDGTDNNVNKLENIITVTEYAAQTGRRHSAPELITELGLPQPGTESLSSTVPESSSSVVISSSLSIDKEITIMPTTTSVPSPPDTYIRTENFTENSSPSNTHPPTIPATPLTVKPVNISVPLSASSSAFSASSSVLSTSRERGIFDIHTGPKSSSNGRIFYLYDPLGAAVVWRDAILAAKNEALRVQQFYSNHSTLSASTGSSIISSMNIVHNETSR